jgi:cytochrome c5
MKINLVSIFIFCLACFSCSDNSIEDEKENLPAPISNGNGGTTKTITYTNYTKKIIDDNCISCHSPTGLNVTPHLTTYAQVKAITDTGRLKARVIDEIPTRMPTTGSLPQTVKDTLQLWIDQGVAE